MHIPIHAVMICRLFDDETFDGNVSNQLDIFYALIGIILKAAEIKSIEIALEKPSLTEEEKERLSNKKKSYLKKGVLDVFKEKKDVLIKLGHTVFEGNENSLIGFSNLDEDNFRKSLSKSGLSEDEVESVLRWDFLEQKTVDGKSVIQFSHRNFRELVVGLFASHASTDLPLP